MIEINVNRVADKLTTQTEKVVLNAYKESLDSMRLQMGKLYEKYSKNGSLTYAEMTKYNRLKSMQTSIQSNIGGVYKTLGTETRALAKKVYEESFFRYGWSIEQTMGVNLSYGLINPKVIQASIENPIAGLTLKETLAKNRLNVVTNLKQNITQGLVLGESYDKMARRIKDTLDGDATKAMRVVRTEGHRNANQGRLASLEHASKQGVDVIKEWRAGFDERTRDTHRALDGQRRKTGEDFVSPSGASGPAPGMLGRAEEDINCRCTLRPIVNGWEPSVRKDMLNKQLIPYTTYTDWASAKGIAVSNLLTPGKAEIKGLTDLDTLVRSTKTGLGDAIKGGDHENSLGKYIDENGNLTPEREALHQEIINSLFEGKTPVYGQPTFTLMGGGPATGKSSVIKSGDVVIDANTVKIDSDDIKKLLPEYQKGLELKNAGIASYVHEESSALAKRAMSIANTGHYNTLLDGTGDGSIASLTKKITEARASGAKVVGNYVTCSTQEALKRNAERALKTGRLPPPEMLIRTHKAVSDIAPQTAHLFDEIRLYDTNNGIKLIATGGNGKGFTPVKGMERFYQDFLDKAFE